AGVGKWDQQDIVDLLQTGVSAKGTVFGPMSEVVEQSLQHLSQEDAKAMAGYLKSLPQTDAPSNPVERGASQDAESVMKLGAKLYDKHCSGCHQPDGKGHPPAYAPLAGNRALTMHSAVNPIRMVLNGGYPPSTSGNPRPFGMPPYGYLLNDTEVAAVVSYMRNSWGNHADLVAPAEVSRYRGAPLD
ncbi:MAG: c-type cytochrome, partial [Methylomonas sp.]